MNFKEQYEPKDIVNTSYLEQPVNSAMVTEGFIYGKEEQAVHGGFLHKAIDLAANYGTPVVAAASGYAVRGYNRFVVTNDDASIRTLQGLPISQGFGYFVQIYHPEYICGVQGGRITQYAHLGNVNPEIKLQEREPVKFDILEEIRRHYREKDPYFDPSQIIDQNETLIRQFPWVEWTYDATVHANMENTDIFTFHQAEIEAEAQKENPYIKWVEQGQVIGHIGLSGVIWGDLTYIEGKNNTDVNDFPNWDEPHLHFEEAGRNPETRYKFKQRDPYGIYNTAEHYQNIHPAGELFLNRLEG